ncbi:glycosyltransferase family 4 protein [Candidatus Saccharibacteria bacterium]|nr:glycosyltransferase family 4 protein [Candidatus Saccharibacteria bacterium]
MLGWELPPHNSGGLGVACYFLSKSLAAQGAEIDFIVPYVAEHNISFMNILSATHLDPLYKFGMGAYDTSFIEAINFNHKDPGEIRSIRDIQRLYCDYVVRYLEDNKPETVHAHDWLTFEAGILAKRLHGIPFIAHVHATEFDRSGADGGNPVIHEIEYHGLCEADHIVAVSQATKDIIVSRYNIPAEKIDVVYNGFDAEAYDKEKYQYDESTLHYLEHMKSQGYTIISTVGRFTIQKGMTYLVRAAARAIQSHDKLIFLFAGDGEQRDELIRLAADLGIVDKVIFTGFIRGKQLRDIYSASDVFVMSSVSEPFGLTALEAAHHGNALIITKQSGVGEILGSIFRYDYWDIDTLADEIINVAKSPVLLSVLQDNIQREYTNITWDDVAHKCFTAYNKAMNPGGK